MVAVSVEKKAPNLRLVLEGLVAHFLGAKNMERAAADAEALGRELSRALLAGVSKDDEATLKALAEARGEAVREGLLGSGKVPPEQVFLSRTELSSEATDKDGVNAPLELGAR